MLVTNSEFKLSGAGVNEKKLSIFGRIVCVVDYGLCRLIEVGKRQAERPLLSIELALCVAQCMGRRYAVAVQTAGMV